MQRLAGGGIIGQTKGASASLLHLCVGHTWIWRLPADSTSHQESSSQTRALSWSVSRISDHDAAIAPCHDHPFLSLLSCVNDCLVNTARFLPRYQISHLDLQAV